MIEDVRAGKRAPGPLAASAAAVVLFASVAVAAWWLIGDLSYTGPVDDDLGLDYMMRAPDVPGWLTTGAGLAGVGLALLSARILVMPTHTRAPALWIAGAGALLAFMARVMTAGVIGANFGGGLSVLFGLPVVAAVTVVSLVLIARRAHTRRH